MVRPLLSLLEHEIRLCFHPKFYDNHVLVCYITLLKSLLRMLVQQYSIKPDRVKFVEFSLNLFIELGQISWLLHFPHFDLHNGEISNF